MSQRSAHRTLQFDRLVALPPQKPSLNQYGFWKMGHQQHPARPPSSEFASKLVHGWLVVGHPVHICDRWPVYAVRDFRDDAPVRPILGS